MIIKKIFNNIVFAEGTNNFKVNQIVGFGNKGRGIVHSAKINEAYIISLNEISDIEIGTEITEIKEEKINFYKHYLGKIISPFGDIFKPKNFEIDASKMKILGSQVISKKSPMILEREKISIPLKTGITLIDTIIPIGFGQRQLIIGDRYTGKTSMIISTIINQKDNDVYSLYVAIGQKRGDVLHVYDILEKNNALDKVSIIFSNPANSGEQFLTPYIAMAMAESLAYQGKKVIIFFDDLSSHAKICREISLLIGITPGRESYPNDIFYLHSYLLEKSGSFSKEFNYGSITCFPVVETIQGNIGSLISSNIISICDGLITTDINKFNKGIIPAINVNLSVSRIGSSAQTKLIRSNSSNLKIEYLKLHEIKKFAEISPELSENIKKKIEKWKGIEVLFYQKTYKSFSEELMVILITLFQNNYLNDIKNNDLFLITFKNFVKYDISAKKIIEDIKTKNHDWAKIKKNIFIVFGSLIKALNGDYNDIISKNEIDDLGREQ